MHTESQWLLLCGFLVMLMQAGFTCLESGLVRAKNSINVAIKNLVDFCISIVLFALVGYGLMFGTSAGGWVGTDSFGLSGLGPAALAFFFFQAVFCGTATTIVSGAVAERMRFSSYAFVALLLSGFIYPIAGHWAWAQSIDGSPQGWLAKLGFIDFAGSTVVHSMGGWVALAALIMVGPRLGRFGKSRSRMIEGHSLPIAALGVFLLWFGWFGFNAGSTLQFDSRVPAIVVNTAMSGAVGGLVAMLLSWMETRRPAAERVMNGVLAGLVAITASCDLVSPGSAVLIAGIGAFVADRASRLLLRFRIDDAIDAVPVHLAAGIWGTLAVALFAPLDALPAGSRWGQFGVQFAGVASIGLFALSAGFAGILAYRKFATLRVSHRDEIIGLNIAEHGATTSLLDLLSQMDVQAHTGDFSRPINVEQQSEASQVAAFYNAVLEKFNLEIDRRKLAMERLADIANHDPLTGLGNRRLLLESLRRTLSLATENHQGAMLYLDLDGFKQINDTVGHDAGDALLREVARRLQVIAGHQAVLGRLGGDEFAVVLAPLDKPQEDASEIAKRIIEALSEPCEYAGQALRVGVSVGIAVFGPDRSETVKNLVRKADEAMYLAKMAGKGTFQFYGAVETG
ncbi:MAG: ammonium transporter [Xanthomonadales bacterium]|nr:ammonium transporter [Xanthomonadales bacterium]